MTTRVLIAAVTACAVLLWGVVMAQEPRSIPRIGALVPPIANSPIEEGLREGLRDLGYVESTNVIIDWRRSPQTAEALRPLAMDLVKSQVKLIVAIGSSATRAALEASTTTPVVFTSGDPAGAGFVSTLAQPGHNATGVSVLSTQLNQKRLEFLHELAPRARRILYLTNFSNPLGQQDRDAVKAAAQTIGIQMVTLNARNIHELGTALRALPRDEAQAFLIWGDLSLFSHRAEIARAVRSARLPGMFPYREYHDAEVLVSYGPSLKQMMQLVARYVDKILKGARPADLPVEQMSKYELIINLRVARRLGLEVPQSLLLRADELIR